MELLPVLEPQEEPKGGIWYSLIPRGGAPGVSVGHTCTYIPSGEGCKGNIFIVGGANPNGSFSQSHVINLDQHEWDLPEWEGLEARYEHCTFVPESCPQSLWVFGGAQQSGNRSCIQKLQLPGGGSCWRTVLMDGKPPSPRTYHTNSACVGDKLYVFSGGEAGATPVADPKLHVFDTVTSAWSQPETGGKHPTARHGHVITAVGSTLYIHGGMDGDKFHRDMFSLDLSSMKWGKVPAKGDIPPGVAAHTAVALDKNIYTFGGMTTEGASNSMYKFHTVKKQWTLIQFEGDSPPNRLDHSMCLVPWKVTVEEEEKGRPPDGACSTETVQLAFIFGGMDTQGVIYSDCFVTVLT